MDKYISPENLNDKLGRDLKLTIIDLRQAHEFEKGHIPTAINIPVDKLADSLIDVPDDGLVVVYCGQEESSEEMPCLSAVDLLSKTGHKAQILEGGYSAWQKYEKTAREQIRN